MRKIMTQIVKNVKAKVSPPTSSIREKLEKRFAPGWGAWIECDSGWDWILEDLDKKLSYLDPKYKLSQVKEKFGTLRFYYETSAKKEVVRALMEDAVEVAERLSAYTCEMCGNSSRISDSRRGIKWDITAGLKSRGGSENGWLKTLCDSCGDKVGYSYIESDSGSEAN